MDKKSNQKARKVMPTDEKFDSTLMNEATVDWLCAHRVLPAGNNISLRESSEFDSEQDNHIPNAFSDIRSAYSKQNP